MEYTYEVRWSEEDHLFIGTVKEFPSLAVHAKTEQDCLQEIKNLVINVIEDLKENNEPIPVPEN